MRRLRTPLLLACLSLSLLATTLGAQQVWIVDAANGPGASFTDLPPAVQAARAGDTILVREAATAYDANVTIRVGLTLLGLDDPAQPWLPQLRGQLNVTGLPAGDAFVLRDFDSAPGTALIPCALQVRLATNLGRVHIERLTPRTLTRPWRTGPVDIDGCNHVTIVRSQLAEVTCTNSDLLCVEAELRGTGSVCRTYAPCTPAAVGLTANNAQVTLVDCDVTGGDGGSRCYTNTTFGAAAITAVGTTIAATGASGTIRGGSVPRQCMQRQEPALVATGGSFAFDPSVTIVGGTTGTAQVSQRSIPWLRTGEARAGTALQFDLGATVGATVATLISLPDGPAPTPWGSLWLAPGSLILIDVSVVGPAGQVTFSRPLPPILPLGMPLAAQASVLDTGTLTLSTASVSIL